MPRELIAPHSAPRSSLYLVVSHFRGIYCNIFFILASKLVRWCSWLSRSPHSLVSVVRAKGREFEPRLNHPAVFLLCRRSRCEVDRRGGILFAQNLISKIAKNLS